MSDAPSTVRRIGGTGPVLDPLEWDVKLYLALNGAVHDAAITAWGIKRRYDTIRPISVIRYMGGNGQSSDPMAPSYSTTGLPLVPGLIELITAATTAPGQRHEALAGHEGEIAVLAWPGEPDDPTTTVRGARWLRAVEWVPYQRKTFVTPAFPGYISGHSTFSRAAAEVLTRFTGSAFFPGGLGEFIATGERLPHVREGPEPDGRAAVGDATTTRRTRPGCRVSTAASTSRPTTSPDVGSARRSASRRSTARLPSSRAPDGEGPMPELPDVVVYLEALTSRIMDARLERVRLASPFLLRSIDPPLDDVFGRRVTTLGRLGKRVVIGLEEERFLVIHLMIAGRFKWKPTGAKVPGKLGLAAFDFSTGTLVLTEAGTRKRASLHVVRGRAGARGVRSGRRRAAHGGPRRFPCGTGRREPHAQADAHRPAHVQRHRQCLLGRDPPSRAALARPPLAAARRRRGRSPVAGDAGGAHRMDGSSARRRPATRFPEHVTAFREGMAVHGRYREPCPVCGTPVQRIAHAENETNYCPTCQTGGRLLADRALSRLLGADWPRTLEELEQRLRGS